MNYIDYAIIAILVLGLIIGLFKGFIKPTLSILSWCTIIALIYFCGQQIATMLGATPLGDLLEGFVRSTLEPLGEIGSEAVVKNADGAWIIASSGIALSEAITTIPQFVLNIITGAFTENVTLADNITTTLSNYVLLAISTAIIMIGSGIVFAIISAILRRFVTVKVVVLNRCLGAVLQVVLACMFVFFLIFLINIVMSFVQIDTLKTLMENSAIVKFIGDFNPIEWIIKAVMKG